MWIKFGGCLFRVCEIEAVESRELQMQIKANGKVYGEILSTTEELNKRLDEIKAYLNEKEVINLD